MNGGVGDLSFADEERRAFDEDNFFDELTPISGPEEDDHRNNSHNNSHNARQESIRTSFDFNKIPPVRSLIAVQSEFINFNTAAGKQLQQQQSEQQQQQQIPPPK